MIKNSKGMTIIEIIVSIALISIVLIFIIGLFLNVQSDYKFSKSQANYEVLKSNIIKIVSDDIINYKLESIEHVSDKEINLHFNSYRQANLSEKIVKTLLIDEKNNKYNISYKYKADINSLTNEEKIKTFVRELPMDIDETNLKIILNEIYNYREIKIPLMDAYGNNYDINIYGKIG